MLLSFLPADFEVPLLQNVAEGALDKQPQQQSCKYNVHETSGVIPVRHHHVKLTSWMEFLRHFDLIRRLLWLHCSHALCSMNRRLQVAAMQDSDAI